MNKIVRIILITIIMLLAFNSYAYEVVTIGKAIIVDKKLRDAYYSAINSAKYSAIHYYYREHGMLEEISINENYLKFIKSYAILEQNIEEGSTVHVKLKVVLDDTALQDANLLLNQHVDSLVFLHRGIDDNIIDNRQVSRYISSTLSNNQFSLSNEALFLGKLDDIYDNKKIERAFNDTKSNSLIIFDFRIIKNIEEFKNKNNKCEIETTASIQGKQNDPKKIQIVIGDVENNINKCYNNAINKSVDDIIAYIRNNIIKLPESAAKLYKYNIDFINTSNLILTKNIIESLLEKGWIKSYKSISYTQNNIVFEVDTFFAPANLRDKIEDLQDITQSYKIEANNNQLILDFSAE